MISFDSASVSFDAGGATYELLIDVVRGEPDDDADEPADDDAAADEWSAEVTTTASSLPLSAEQRLLLVALAEAQLRDPSAVLDLPTNRQIASSLHWTITKYNRKLDGLCVKFAAHGVGGLRGSTDALARDRRLRLVDHALHSGIVTPADLPLLEEAAPDVVPPGRPVGDCVPVDTVERRPYVERWRRTRPADTTKGHTTHVW